MGARFDMGMRGMEVAHGAYLAMARIDVARTCKMSVCSESACGTVLASADTRALAALRRRVPAKGQRKYGPRATISAALRVGTTAVQDFFVDET